MPAFYGGLFLLSASTMIYEIMLARLLSVVTWYYLALAAVGMAMSGMTAGALVVQLKPSFFEQALMTAASGRARLPWRWRFRWG